MDETNTVTYKDLPTRRLQQMLFEADRTTQPQTLERQV